MLLATELSLLVVVAEENYLQDMEINLMVMAAELLERVGIRAISAMAGLVTVAVALNQQAVQEVKMAERAVQEL
jgi:sulfur carrier protein ThiS